MKYNKLGNTELIVSEICLGSLTMGPLQSNLSFDEGSEIIIHAMNKGINFIDTAELYRTYGHIKAAIKKSDKKPIISTKCYAYDKAGAEKSLERARKELDIDVIDIFLLHEQESIHTINGHREALDYFCNAKEKGIIKAVGLSTHHVAGVLAGIDTKDIDVIHPIINKNGIGIVDGTLENMLTATSKAHLAGKGIFSMKALGGGNLINSYKECIDFIKNLGFVDSVAIGMQSIDEVEMNIAYFCDNKIDNTISSKVSNKNRKLHIEGYCIGCGKCVERCGQHAMEIVNGTAVVEKEKCVLCGYCGAVCPEFAIKIF